MISVPNLVWKWFKCAACSLLTYQQFDTNTSRLFARFPAIPLGCCGASSPVARPWLSALWNFFAINSAKDRLRQADSMLLIRTLLLLSDRMQISFSLLSVPSSSLAMVGKSRRVCRGRGRGIYSNWELTHLERVCFSYGYFGNDGEHLDTLRPTGRRALYSPPELFRNCCIWLSFLKGIPLWPLQRINFQLFAWATPQSGFLWNSWRDPLGKF